MSVVIDLRNVSQIKPFHMEKLELGNSRLHENILYLSLCSLSTEKNNMDNIFCRKMVDSYQWWYIVSCLEVNKGFSKWAFPCKPFHPRDF